jgi:hypothetical protein
MTTPLELLKKIDRLLSSGIDAETTLDAIRGLLELERDEDGELDLSKAAADEIAQAVRSAFKEGRNAALRANVENFETVAAQRDELATKLHEMGKRRFDALTADDRKRIAMTWLQRQVQTSFIARFTWQPREVLPPVHGWYHVRSPDLADSTLALWDGDAFIMMRKRRLNAGESWSKL